MSKIILQPSGNQDAREHFVDTIATPVSLARIQPFISPEDLQILNEIYPSGSCYIWGVTSGGSNITKWNRISIGDITLFSRNNLIYSSGVATYKLHNRALAENLWNYNANGLTWEYIYFLDEIKVLNITYRSFNRSVGYADNYVIQGFNVLTEEQSQRVIRNFDLESAMYAENINDDDFLAIVDRLDQLEETDYEVKSKRRKEQHYLSALLFGRRTIVACGLCAKEYPVSFLVTAHIKRRSNCTRAEKLDRNVVIPLCNFGCDELFERGYVSVLNGEIVDLHKTPTSPDLIQYKNDLVGNRCIYFNDNNRVYFDWHRTFHIGELN